MEPAFHELEDQLQFPTFHFSLSKSFSLGGKQIRGKIHLPIRNEQCPSPKDSIILPPSLLCTFSFDVQIKLFEVVLLGPHFAKVVHHTCPTHDVLVSLNFLS